jgi:hypothetical protein
MTDEQELQLRIDVMKADLSLKTRQSFWETPKAVAIIVATTAAVFSAVAGFAGYKLGSQPPQTIVIQVPQAPQVVR